MYYLEPKKTIKEINKEASVLLHLIQDPITDCSERAQWLSGRVLDTRPRGCRFEPHWSHCVASLSKTH